jgi:hypothetical protein
MTLDPVINDPLDADAQFPAANAAISIASDDMRVLYISPRPRRWPAPGGVVA